MTPLGPDEYCPSCKQTGKHRFGLRAELRERGRLAYVTGECSTLTEVATWLQRNAASVRRVAACERWKDQRVAHQRRIAEEARAAVVRAEIKAWATARRTAWAATQLSLAKLVKQLQQPDYQVSAFAVKAIASTALLLSEQEHTSLEEADQLGAHSIRELAQRALEAIEEGLGGGRPEGAHDQSQRRR